MIIHVVCDIFFYINTITYIFFSSYIYNIHIYIYVIDWENHGLLWIPLEPINLIVFVPVCRALNEGHWLATWRWLGIPRTVCLTGIFSRNIYRKSWFLHSNMEVSFGIFYQLVLRPWDSWISELWICFGRNNGSGKRHGTFSLDRLNRVM